MRTKATASLGLALKLFGCNAGETDKFVQLVTSNNFIWYKFENNDLERIYDYVEDCKAEDEPIPVDDFFAVEHLISELKRRCMEEKRKL